MLFLFLGFSEGTVLIFILLLVIATCAIKRLVGVFHYVSQQEAERSVLLAILSLIAFNVILIIKYKEVLC